MTRHPAGDALLRRVGESLREAVRATDRVYRYGGDEFAVLLLAALPVQAADAAERVRTAVSTISMAGEVRVTASLGAACFPGDAATTRELVGAADAALYRAKRLGGDAVDLAASGKAAVLSA